MLRIRHTSILRSPAHHAADTFRFEYVLGRSRSLPYEYFSHKPVFEMFLATEFKGIPGDSKVLQGRYLILDKQSGQEPITDEEWAIRVFPGSQLFMSMFIELSAHSGTQAQCLRLGCSGFGQRRHKQDMFTKWSALPAAQLFRDH
jgi:hypothetical protein